MEAYRILLDTCIQVGRALGHGWVNTEPETKHELADAYDVYATMRRMGDRDKLQNSLISFYSSAAESWRTVDYKTVNTWCSDAPGSMLSYVGRTHKVRLEVNSRVVSVIWEVDSPSYRHVKLALERNPNGWLLLETDPDVDWGRIDPGDPLQRPLALLREVGIIQQSAA